MFGNNKLKPLSHKKSLNTQQQKPATVQIKTTVKKMQISPPSQKKTTQAAQIQSNPAFKKVLYTRGTSRQTKKIELYDCDDFEMPGLEDDGYFQKQIQKSIKVECQNPNKVQKNVPKNQVILPKLEGNLSIKQMKDLEKQMDMEMSSMLDKELNQEL